MEDRFITAMKFRLPDRGKMAATQTEIPDMKKSVQKKQST